MVSVLAQQTLPHGLRTRRTRATPGPGRLRPAASDRTCRL